MPNRLPDDVAVQKVRESEDREFLIRVYSAAKTRLEQLDGSAAKKRRESQGWVEEGSDVAANPGR